MSKSNNEKRTFWVTGSSSGIGLELVRMLARQHHFVFVSARSEEKLALLRDTYPENISVVPMDLMCPHSIDEAEATLKMHTDYLDTVIACAGVCEFDEDLQLSADLFERVTRTNYLGLVETIRIALPFLRQSRNSPHIVGLGSLSSVVPFPRAAAYGASKAALDYFLQSLKIDLAQEKIDVSIVRPGSVDTHFSLKKHCDQTFMVPAKKSAEKILCALHSRRLFYDFPFRLSVMIKFMRWVPFVWISLIAPKYRRRETL